MPNSSFHVFEHHFRDAAKALPDMHKAAGHNRLLGAMPADAVVLLEREFKDVSLAAGMVLLEPGAVIDNVYFPQSGMISLMVVTREGQNIETGVVGREGAVGLNAGFGPRRSLTRAVTQIAGRFSAIRASRFEEIARENAEVRDVIAAYTELLWIEAQQLAACNAVHDAASRLNRWLLQCADRIEGDHLPLTQEFLAQMLGVRRTTVTLLAQSLQAKGQIRYSRGHIAIRDRAALEARTCECYHVLRDAQLPLAPAAAHPAYELGNMQSLSAGA